MAVLKAFPSLTEHEFLHACKALEDRSFDKLNGTDWLSVKQSEHELLIKQKRSIQTLDRGNSNEDGENEEWQEVIEDSSTSDTIRLDSQSSAPLTVDFSITLSPTYCVPVLWFWCEQYSGRTALGIEEVYDWVVPHASQAPLRSVGVMGGISMAVSRLAPCKRPDR